MFRLTVYLLTFGNVPLVEKPFEANRGFYSMQECEAARDAADALWGEFKRETGLMIKFKFTCE